MSTGRANLFVARAPHVSIGGAKRSIVVPAYNEAYRLPVLLESLRHHLHGDDELIIVDDGSTDDTVAVAERAADWSSRVQVLSHATNQGKGAAVRTGVAASSGHVVAFVDADNATDLAAFDDMCDCVAGDVGAVFGSRHAPGAVVTGSPPIRGLMGRVFNHIVRFAAGTAITDTQCGAKVFRGAAARLVFGELETDGFAFDVEVLRRLVALGFEVVEHPVHWQYVHGTKIQALTPLRMLADIGRLRMRPTPVVRHVVETTATEAAHQIAEPLFDSAEGAERRTSGGEAEPCRIVVPDAQAAIQVAEWLRAQGQDAQVAR